MTAKTTRVIAKSYAHAGGADTNRTFRFIVRAGRPWRGHRDGAVAPAMT